MFRFLLIFLIFIACTYIGYYFGEMYKCRTTELKELQKSLILMNSEVLYSNTPLPIALNQISNKLTGPLKNIYKDISRDLEKGDVLSVYEGFNNSYERYKNELHLKNDDLSIIMDFFSSLGESGVYGQEKIFTLAIENLKRNYIEAEKESKINTKMYRSIGLCVGAILAIFFI